VPDHPVTAWEPEHVGEFFSRAGRHRLGSAFELSVYTATRRGEIAGLHWADVDLVARTIVVRHSRVSVDGRVQETITKTRSGRRTVPLSDAAAAALLTFNCPGVRSVKQPRKPGRRKGTSSRWRMADP
jgi:integrase